MSKINYRFGLQYEKNLDYISMSDYLTLNNNFIKDCSGNKINDIPEFISIEIDKEVFYLENIGNNEYKHLQLKEPYISYTPEEIANQFEKMIDANILFDNRSNELMMFEDTICIYLDVLGFSKCIYDSFENSQYNYFLKFNDVVKRYKNKFTLADNGRLNYVSFFSDSLAHIYSYNNNSKYEFDACTKKISGEIIWFLLELIEAGFIFRGGISSGKTIIDSPAMSEALDKNHYHSENIIFSESFTKAVKIEEEIEYPIIAIMPDTFNLIYKLESGCGNGYAGQVLKNIILPLADITGKGSDDNKYFLNHLGQIIRIGDDVTAYDFLKRHNEFIKKRLEQYANDDTVKMKYIFLAKYHNYIIEQENFDYDLLIDLI